MLFATLYQQRARTVDVCVCGINFARNTKNMEKGTGLPHGACVARIVLNKVWDLLKKIRYSSVNNFEHIAFGRYNSNFISESNTDALLTTIVAFSNDR